MRESDHAAALHVTTPASRWKIAVHWSTKLGCPIEALAQRETTLVALPPLHRWLGAFFFHTGSALVVTAPLPYLSVLHDAVDGRQPNEIFTIERAREIFGVQAETIVGPAWLGYADSSDNHRLMGGHARQLHAEDAAALRTLRLACASEWELSGITAASPVIYGVFADDVLAAAGTVEDSGMDILNLGIITHPDCRRQGYGRMVAAALTRYGMARNAVMQYRTLQSNAGSMAIAASLGYQPYGATIAVRLRPTP